MQRKYTPAPGESRLAESLVNIAWDTYGEQWLRISFQLFPIDDDGLMNQSLVEWTSGQRQWAPALVPCHRKETVLSQVRQLIHTASLDIPHINGVHVHLDRGGLIGCDYVFDLFSTTPLFSPAPVAAPEVDQTIVDCCLKTLNRPGPFIMDFMRFTFLRHPSGQYVGWFRYGTDRSHLAKFSLNPEVCAALDQSHPGSPWNVLQIDFDDDFQPTVQYHQDPIIADLVAVQTAE